MLVGLAVIFFMVSCIWKFCESTKDLVKWWREETTS